MALIDEIIEKGSEKFIEEDRPLLIEDIASSYEEVHRDGKKTINALKRDLLTEQYNLEEHDPELIAEIMENIDAAENKLKFVGEAYFKMFGKTIDKKEK